MQNNLSKWFIMGLPGCGKSTLLNALKYKLNLAGIDLDLSLEDRLGMSISSFWNFYGEDNFRIIERQNLLKQISSDYILYACGGGTPQYFDNLSYMKYFGNTLYLSCSISTLVKRISASNTRPLFKKLSPLEIELKLQKLYLQRKSFFERADFIINVDLDEQSVINKVIHIIK